MKNHKSIKQSLSNSGLIAGYLAGTLSDNELDKLNQWLEEDVHNRELFERLTDVEKLKSDISHIEGLEDDLALKKVWERIKLQETTGKLDKEDIQLGRFSSIFSKSHIRLISLGAAAMLAIIPIIWFYLQPSTTEDKTIVKLEESDVDAAKVGATLTLPNGKTIRLNEATEGELAKGLGVAINKAADGKLVYEIASASDANARMDSSLNILRTSRGETYTVKLPDGTIVELNSASTLEYPMNFMLTNKRQVKLNGEAYFQVAHNAAKPFIINYKNQSAEVLGTEFNINAYDNEDESITTLVKGSLRVNALNNTPTVLKPGYATFFDGRYLTSSKTELTPHIAWKDGKFYFDKTSFDVIARQFSRWYNIDIEFVNNKAPQVKFSGEMSRNVSLKAILSYFDELGIKFKLEKRKLIIG